MTGLSPAKSTTAVYSSNQHSHNSNLNTQSHQTYPIAQSISTSHDPDHLSYSRHMESSESARCLSMTNPENESFDKLSSFLSASSSLSGSQQHPVDDDDDEEYSNDDEQYNSKCSNTIPENTNFPSSSQKQFKEKTKNNDQTPISSPSSSSSFDLQKNHLLTSQQIVQRMNDASNYSTNIGSKSSSKTNLNSDNHYSISSNASKRFRFKHYHKPKVTDSPRLVFLCQQFVKESNIDCLALIARRRGLPPKLRHLIWPLLIANHPYVLNPSIRTETTASFSKELIPVNRISNEISRYLKKLQYVKRNINHTRLTSSNNNSNTNSTNYPVGPLAPEMSSRPISKDINTHPYFSSVSPLANGISDASSDQVTLSSYPSMSNISNNSFSTNQNNSDDYDSRYKAIIQDSIEFFLKKWGHIIPYEPGMVYAAFALAEWVDPLPSQSSFDPTKRDNESQIDSQSGSISTSSPTESSSLSLKSLQSIPYSFREVYSNFMLILCHSPSDQAEESNSASSHTGRYSGSSYGKQTASSITNRISFFLSAFRRLLPELAEHFDEEDVLAGTGGDEWLLYWIKWLGSKVWDKRDRGRIWDMCLGWRIESDIPSDSQFSEAVMKTVSKLNGGFFTTDEDNNIVITKEGNNDRFDVDSMELPINTPQSFGENQNKSNDSTPEIESSAHNTSVDELSSSFSLNLQISSSISSNNTSNSNSKPHDTSPPSTGIVIDLSQVETELGPDPFWTPLDLEEDGVPKTQIEPLTEHLFVCLALLKSKFSTLIELDQSEIRGCLSKLYRSKDIESVIAEAGELWRNWQYTEELDD